MHYVVVRMLSDTLLRLPRKNYCCELEDMFA